MPVPLVVVTSAGQGDGKTAVATAIARHYAYLGSPVRLVRVATSDPESNAAADAMFYGSLSFAPDSPTAAADWTDLNVHDPGVTILEADALPDSLPGGARLVWVTRADAPVAAPPGAGATVTMFVPGLQGARAESPEGRPLSISIGEDRTLAGFTVDDVRATLHAEVLVEGDDTGATCDHLVIAPIASDAGQPYFRRFGTKAVVVRFDKTDMHLAAMQADPACLVLTGGRRPSEYLFDAAGAKGVPVLLSRTDTENTVIALEGIFDRTRFSGERKLDRMAALLEGTGLYEALAI